MVIKKDTIKYVADLARLSLTRAEEELYAQQLNDILGYMDKLNSLDTKDIDPMSHAGSLGNVLRKDSIRESVSNKEALENAPEEKDGSFKVPKVIE